LPGIVGGIIAPVAILLASVSWAGQSVTQPALRAAFLYNFAKFTEWTSDGSASGPLKICIVDDSAVEGALSDLVGGSTINGRTVVISRGVRPRACHLLYLGDVDRDRAVAILDELHGAAVLTVSDGHEFVRLGGIVGLFVDEGRMRFAINPDAAQRAGLRLSSRLLQLAKILKDDGHGTR
jgi:uncharacterized protein DUF4154